MSASTSLCMSLYLLLQLAAWETGCEWRGV